MEHKRPIYLDNAATTKLNPAARKTMTEILDGPRNPSAAHSTGRETAMLLREYRARCAACLGTIENEVVFTSGGTESNNLAIQGYFRHLRRTQSPSSVKKPPVFAHSAVEHSSVHRTIGFIDADGAQVVALPVTTVSIVEPSEIESVMSRDIRLVSVLLGNNELGVVQPILDLVQVVKKVSPTCVFHTDAVQCLGKVPVRPDELGVDMLSLSAHKFGGPKGIGLLWIGRGLFIDPIFGGGKQERGLRPGTENLPAIAGMTVTLEEAVKNQAETYSKLSVLRDALEEEVLGMGVGAWVNCMDAHRLPHISSVTFPGVNAESLLLALDREGIYVSTGSACSTGNPNPSPTLLAIGLTPEEAKSTIRFSFGEGNDMEQVYYVAMKLKEILRRNFRVGA